MQSAKAYMCMNKCQISPNLRINFHFNSADSVTQMPGLIRQGKIWPSVATDLEDIDIHYICIRSIFLLDITLKV